MGAPQSINSTETYIKVPSPQFTEGPHFNGKNVIPLGYIDSFNTARDAPIDTLNVIQRPNC